MISDWKVTTKYVSIDIANNLERDIKLILKNLFFSFLWKLWLVCDK